MVKGTFLLMTISDAGVSNSLLMQMKKVTIVGDKDALLGSSKLQMFFVGCAQ